MRKTKAIFSLAAAFVVLAPFVLAAEDITIQVRFFQGTWMEGQPGLKQVETLSTSSHFEISSLKAKAGRLESELKAAVIDALLDIMNLRTVDDLFSFVKTWNGKDSNLSEPIMQKPASAFRFIFRPKRLSPQALSLQTVLYIKEIKSPSQAGKSADKELLRELYRALAARKSEKLMEKILDKELVLEIGEPVIVGIPYEGRDFFMMVLLTSGSPASEQEAMAEARTSSRTYISAAPKPVHQVVPAYPYELRRQGVEGEVELGVTIDEKGIVLYVEVVKPLHPYLDYAAVQALRQWKFEPVLRKEKPVHSAFILKFNFNQEIWRRFEETLENEETPKADVDVSSREEFRKALEQCAEYCRKLAGSALDFVCEEWIKETHYNFRAEQITAIKNRAFEKVYEERRENGNVIVVLKGNLRLWDPWRTEKNKYVCDYQFVRKGELIKERRVILEENGRKITDRKKLLEEKRFSILMPFSAAVGILARDRQPLFNFRILEEEKVLGKIAYVIEAMPKFGHTESIEYAKIWVDKKDFQILKFEFEGVPLEGYEDVLKETTSLNVKPEFKATHIYQVEKEGILFPSHSKVRVAYPELGYMQSKFLKLKIDMTYDRYKFFTVETEHRIIK